MQIRSNAVVSFHYRLEEEGGGLLEASEPGHPVLYLHGHRGMLPGLEEAFEGRSAGEAFNVTVPPEKGYGLRKEGAVQRVSKKYVLTTGKLRPGMRIQLRTDNGAQEAVLLKVGLKSVDVDGNHPLAGKTLSFAVEIVDVREATAEERAHGHAHGPGGHQH